MYQITPTDKRNINLGDRAFRGGNRATALKYYLKAAENGNDEAMLNCGQIYFEGIFGVEKNDDKAIEWLKKAGQLGNSAAPNNVGYIYGTLGNHMTAISWYEKAANLGDVVSMLNIANTYRQELNNKNKAREWLQKAEKLPDSYSIRKVAEYYFNEDVIETHINKAISLYRKAIRMGDMQACKELGDLYFETEDYENAHHVYQKGANAGNVDCMVEIGLMLFYIPDFFEEAKYWLKKAASKGNISALKVLCDLHEFHGDYATALRWCRKGFLIGEKASVEYLPKIKRRLKKHLPDYKLKLRKV